jgi:hypothetical protein
MRYLFTIIIVLILSCALDAQLLDNVSNNLDIQPGWGPVGYDCVENYYLSDIDAYLSLFKTPSALKRYNFF